ncbi:hypothetical protein JHK86_016235 [Glycine max]|nr:hypothetical protein JHK86_016235 [Glycine max]
MKDLTMGLSINGNNIECLYLRASCYHAVGQFKEVVKDYDAALDLELDSMDKFNPNDGDHLVNTDSCKEKKQKRNKDKTPAPTIDTVVSIIEASEEQKKKMKCDSNKGKTLM